MACQTRNGNLDDFFKYENQGCPPSLSKDGDILHSNTKSELITKCIEPMLPSKSIEEEPMCEVNVMDASSIVHARTPAFAKTFHEYAMNVVFPYLENLITSFQRVDLVWDTYVEHSLKASTRASRGHGARRKVAGDTKIPRDWKAFLRVDENKKELFAYLAEFISSFENENLVISTLQGEIVHNKESYDSENISVCNHEEADTRLLASRNGCNSALITSNDTDVMVISVAKFNVLDLKELWVLFGSGNRHRYLPIHEICETLGPQKSVALPSFYAITGCDQVSFIAGRGTKTFWDAWREDLLGCMERRPSGMHGEKTFWDAWRAYPNVTSAFMSMIHASQDDISSIMKDIERFFIVAYDRGSSCETVDGCRKNLFCKGRSIENIPPTKGALTEHLKRAIYQSGYVWAQCDIKLQNLPCPTEWGWYKTDEGDFEPYWTELPEASDVCRELTKCGCKKGCQKPCSCENIKLKCTALCNCGGHCNRSK